ncbi:hypothetical protein F0U44_10430 [Nocardioides humilatus]|uniref:LppX_LprAFG lipoprotein n=1 Tax=Nocardioides humilatus TaxID=2607660 RepID=A0A5B1LE02_9ACTN|nr:hypothetical protein [Nocardioides humilatus]KAA1418885.1 hypothetical protein F0U44_10430 [Nocardioides humilatus]
MLKMTLAALTLGLALAGCSDEGEPSSSAPEPTTAAPEPAGPSARAAVDSAVAAMVRSDLIDFTYEAVMASQPIVRLEGTQRLLGGWSVSATFDDPTTAGPDNLGLEARSAHGTTWMQMAGWPAPMTGCWLTMGPTQVPVGITGLLPDEAGYVSMLAGLRGRDFVDGSDDRVAVELPFRYAQAVLPGRLLQQIEMSRPAARHAVVDAEVTLEKGRVATIEVHGRDVAASITSAGGTMTDDAAQFAAFIDFTVSFATSQNGQVAGPPPVDLVVTADEMEQDGCH